MLVLTKKVSVDEKELQLEVEKLHNLLFHVESVDNFCIANEIIDLNSYRIIGDPIRIKRIITKNKLKSFQFVNNKN